MTKEQRADVSFALSCVLGVTWLAYVAWTVIQQRRLSREAEASLQRLEKIAKDARVMRGGDGATIMSPAPSES